jgi:hypothetical protein
MPCGGLSAGPEPVETVEANQDWPGSPHADVYAATGTFADTHQPAADLATAVMTIEQVPDIATFRKNIAAFVHGLDAGCLANVDGDSNCVRVEVLTNCGAPDHDR